MRHSQQVATYTEMGAMTRLCDKYSFKGFIGDQVRLAFIRCRVDTSILFFSRTGGIL